MRACGIGLGVVIVLWEVLNAQASGLQDVDFPHLLAAANGCDQPAAINVLEYGDLTHSGKQQAVVVASTCNTGTAGPDVHSVYELGADDKPSELPIEEPPKEKVGHLLGNANSLLHIENGKLVERYADTSGRDNPLVIHYAWKGTKFVPDSIEAAKPYKPSFDCSKASAEIEFAICYTEALADLDVQLGQKYSKALKSASPAKRAQLQTAQRVWMKKREKDCPIYKWWVECLTEHYQARLKELGP